MCQGGSNGLYNDPFTDEASNLARIFGGLFLYFSEISRNRDHHIFNLFLISSLFGTLFKFLENCGWYLLREQQSFLLNGLDFNFNFFTALYLFDRERPIFSKFLDLWIVKLLPNKPLGIINRVADVIRVVQCCISHNHLIIWLKCYYRWGRRFAGIRVW